MKQSLKAIRRRGRLASPGDSANEWVKTAMPTFVSRAGQKLDFALATWQIDVRDKVCADLGCNAGGFVDCLLQRGAARIYAVDTGYGMLAWKLRNDPRVVVMERTNAIHATLPQKVDLVSIDVAWTRQRHILPAARRMLADDGIVVSLIKPHYEAHPRLLRKGVLPPEQMDSVIEKVKADIRACDFELSATLPSPIKGAKGNLELLALLR